MKILILFLSLTVTSLMYSQTKLINHKSHSGSNATFVVSTVEGNLGLPGPSRREIKEDVKSNYKLTSTFDYQEGEETLTLFKTPNKKINEYVCMANDEILDNITFRGRFGLRDSIVVMLERKLKELRSKEKYSETKTVKSKKNCDIKSVAYIRLQSKESTDNIQIQEIEEDVDSIYKLIVKSIEETNEVFFSGDLTFTLFKTENKIYEEKNIIGRNIIEQVTIEKDSEFRKKTKNLFINKLKQLRSIE